MSTRRAYRAATRGQKGLAKVVTLCHDREVMPLKATVRREIHVASSDKALADELGGRILNGELRPDDPLREQQLVDEYGVGRYTVRAALQRLAHDGLVRLEAHRGATVSKFTADDIREIYWLRGTIEEGAGRALAERAIRPEAAERELRRFESLSDDSSWRSAVEIDIAFHQALVSAVGSDRLDLVFRSLSREMRFCIMQLEPFYSTPSVLANEHRQLLESIASGNGETAAVAIRDHMSRASDDATTVLG